MADNLKRVGLVFDAAGQVEFKKTLNQVNDALANNRNQFELQKQQWDKNTKASEKLRAESDFLSAQYENQGTKVDALKKKLGALESADNRNEKQIEQTRKQLQTAEVQYGKTGKQLADVTEKLKDGENKLKKYGDQLKDTGEKATKAGEGLTKTMTAGVLAVGAAAVAAWSQIDEAYDNITKKTGAVGDEAEGLQNVFNSIYGSMPVDSEVAADAVSALYQQFKLTDDALDVASTQLIQFAEITGGDVTNAALTAKQAIEAYGLQTDDLPKVLDSLAYVSQKTGIAVEELADKSVSGAAQIKGLGLSYEQGIQLLGQLEQNGVDSSAALASMSKASVAYAKDGKTLSQGLAETQKAILGAKNDTEALNIAAEVFGTKGAVRMVDAIKRGTLNLDDLSDAALNADGTVSNTFEGTLDPADKAQVAFNNVKLALAKLGDTIQQSLGPILENFSKWLQSLTTWFSGLNSTQKNAILIIGLLIAAIGPLLVVFGAVAGGLSKIITLFTAESTATAFNTIQKGLATAGTWLYNAAQTALNVVIGVGTAVIQGLSVAMTFLAANPIVLIIAAIALLVAAFVYLWNNSEDFKNFFIDLWAKIQNILEVFSNWLSGIFATDWSKSFGAFGDILNGFMQNASNIFESVKKIFSGIIDFVTGIFSGNWSKAWEGVKKIFSGVFDGFVAIAKAPFNIIIGMLNGLISGVNVFIRALNKIKIPDWVPVVGGNGLNFSELSKLPMLAKGGTLLDGAAIVGEKGAELLVNQGGKSHVIPTSSGGGASQVNLIDYKAMAEAFKQSLVGVKFVIGEDGLGRLIDERLIKVME